MGLTTEFPWLGKPLDRLARMNEKLPSSILITGSRGSGLYELGEAFASSLVCSNPKNGEACGICPECSLNKAGNHPDIKFVLSEAEKAIHPEPWAEPIKATAKKSLRRNIGIEQIREIGEFLATSSVRGGKKVVMVYPANAMMTDQSSALLKTLEEPPPNSVLILVTENLEVMLPTIRSRCQIINVPAPTADEGIAYLKGKGISHPEETLARLGGLPLLYFEEDEKLLLDPELETNLLRFLSKGANAAPSDVMEITSSELPTLPLTILLQRWTNDLVLSANGLPPRYFLRMKEASGKIAKTVNVRKLMKYLDELKKAKRATSIALNPRIIAQDLLLSYVKACKP